MVERAIKIDASTPRWRGRESSSFSVLPGVCQPIGRHSNDRRLEQSHNLSPVIGPRSVIKTNTLETSAKSGWFGWQGEIVGKLGLALFLSVTSGI